MVSDVPASSGVSSTETFTGGAGVALAGIGVTCASICAEARELSAGDVVWEMAEWTKKRRQNDIATRLHAGNRLHWLCLKLAVLSMPEHKSPLPGMTPKRRSNPVNRQNSLSGRCITSRHSECLSRNPSGIGLQAIGTQPLSQAKSRMCAPLEDHPAIC